MFNSCIAIGVLQLIAVCYSSQMHRLFVRYASKTIVSEAIFMIYLRNSIFRMLARNPLLSINKII